MIYIKIPVTADSVTGILIEGKENEYWGQQHEIFAS